MHPLIAIIVPFTTYNCLVEECIRHCLLLNYPNFRLILLPNKYDKELSRVEDTDHRIQIVPTHKSNISFKRNQGFVACPKAEYYACIDSDAYPEPDWLKNALLMFGKNSEIWGVSGPNLSPDYKSLSREAVGNALKSWLANGPRVFMKRLSDDRYTDEVYGCNFLIKHEVVDTIGGFDESLETGEDTDFCRRIRNIGKKIYFCRNVVVYHHNRPLFFPFFKQKLIAGYSVLKLLKREKSFSVIVFFLPFAFLLFILFGWLAGYIHLIFLILWGGGIITYLGAITVEAWRWSKRLVEIPYTMLAIFIANMAPGLGTFAALLRISIDIATFYANFDSRNNPG